MTIGHLFRLYESRSGKFIGEYDTREEAEAVAADTVPKTVINDVRYRIEGEYEPEDNPFYKKPRRESFFCKRLKHPVDFDAPRNPMNWNDPMRGIHPDDQQ
jgi:hypothetical protein